MAVFQVMMQVRIRCAVPALRSDDGSVFHNKRMSCRIWTSYVTLAMKTPLGSACAGYELCPCEHLMLVSPAGTYISHNGWPHLLPSCPVGKRLGWSTSAVCPTTKRLIRLMVDLPSPYWVYQQREMVVQYAEKLENATLLPQDMAGTGMSRSMIPWGCELVSLWKECVPVYKPPSFRCWPQANVLRLGCALDVQHHTYTKHLML